MVIIGLRLTIKAAFTGEVYFNPKKKNMLKPNRPTTPTNKIPLRGISLKLIFRIELIENKSKGTTPNIYRQEAASTKEVS